MTVLVLGKVEEGFYLADAPCCSLAPVFGVDFFLRGSIVFTSCGDLSSTHGVPVLSILYWRVVLASFLPYFLAISTYDILQSPPPGHGIMSLVVSIARASNPFVEVLPFHQRTNRTTVYCFHVLPLYIVSVLSSVFASLEGGSDAWVNRTFLVR